MTRKDLNFLVRYNLHVFSSVIPYIQNSKSQATFQLISTVLYCLVTLDVTSIKWWSEQPSPEKFQHRQDPQPEQTTTRDIKAFETKLNPYGFIYIPKNVLTALPFKIGDKLHLQIDKVNNRVIITPG